MRKTIYLDNGATTMLDPKVVEAMRPCFTEQYGNASSTHEYGRDAKDLLERSRGTIAKTINASPDEILFTSGGTESNNLAIKGVAYANQKKGKHLITTKVEHKCVMESCRWLESQGFKVTYLDVDSEGFVSPEALERAITKETVLFSVIHGNNEIGTIQDLAALGMVCKKHNVLFHTDACQSYTKTALDVKKQHLDLVTLNAHKLHGPKGVGALYVRRGVAISPWQHGGGHEKGNRGGTENIPGIVGFAVAAKLAMDEKHRKQMTKLRDKLIDNVLKIPGVTLNGPRGERRLCNNANFSFAGVEGEAIGGLLDAKGVCSSTGSACSAHSLEPSYVLLAIGLTHEQANGSLRLTLSRFTTEEEIDSTVKVLPEIVEKLRRISPFGKLIDKVLSKV